MEVKLWRPSVPRNLRTPLFIPTASNSGCSHHVHVHPQISGSQIQRIAPPRGRDSTKKFLVHVVQDKKSEQTNEDIADVELILEGQPIRTPSSVEGRLLKAKTRGCFLLLVPLVAFCISCLLGALHRRVADVTKSEENRIRGGSKRMRWKYALTELRDEDEVDSDLSPESDHSTKDQDQIDSSDVSRAYTNLQIDYQKFLSECGISEWGYWRGGYPE